MPMYRKVNTDFFKTWSPDMAYVLGFFAADGNMICGPRGNHYLSFCSTDRSILVQIRKAMDSEHKVAKKQFKKRKKMKHWKTSYQIQIGSKEMFEDLQQLGMTPRKSLNLSFPNVPKEVLSHFVRGYFDGDGCVYFKKHKVKNRKKLKWVFTTRFTSASKKFLEELHRSLGSLVRGGFMLKKHRGYELVFSHKDSLALYRFMYNNVSCSLLLRRKHKIFQKAVKTLYNEE